MGTDSQGAQGAEQDSYNDYENANKTGHSTPGYRKEGGTYCSALCDPILTGPEEEGSSTFRGQ